MKSAEMKMVKVLKVVTNDGGVFMYRCQQPDVAAAHLEFIREEDWRENPVKPDVQRLFQNEGHLTLRYK